MDNLNKRIKELLIKLQELELILDLKGKQFLIDDYKTQQSDPNFWNDSDQAIIVGQELERLLGIVNPFFEIYKDLQEINDFLDLADKDADAELIVDLEEKITGLELKFQNLEFYSLLSGQYDDRPAILSVHAGTGGVDAQDFAQMLERMYLRFCENNNFKVEIIDRTVANEAGIKSAMFRIIGSFAYGYLQSENGVHRLVRISPFDGESLRQTSFALVEVLPELPDNDKVEIRSEDLKIDLYRASGPGGQNVNKTESAVRITHLPTGIVASCQTERSQHQNKELAMKVVYAKLNQLALAEKEDDLQKIKGKTQIAAWGRQIRSYVLQPYQMVKDHRTNYETSNVVAVFDGDLKMFMEEYLRFKKNKEKI